MRSSQGDHLALQIKALLQESRNKAMGKGKAVKGEVKG